MKVHGGQVKQGSAHPLCNSIMSLTFTSIFYLSSPHLTSDTCPFATPHTPTFYHTLTPHSTLHTHLTPTPHIPSLYTHHTHTPHSPLPLPSLHTHLTHHSTLSPYPSFHTLTPHYTLTSPAHSKFSPTITPQSTPHPTPSRNQNIISSLTPWVALEPLAGNQQH